MGNICLTEGERLLSLMQFEREAYAQGYTCVFGIDEAGRGPLAGPVVAAACYIPLDTVIVGVDDSKKLTAEKRERVFADLVHNPAVRYGIGIVSHEVIDQINILQATMLAMHKAIEQVPLKTDLLFVDGLHLPHPTIPCKKIIKGDSLSYSIAAASILAKVTRDRLMMQLHEEFPQYGFNQHKGYPTALHRQKIAVHGLSPVHRKSFTLKKN